MHAQRQRGVVDDEHFHHHRALLRLRLGHLEEARAAEAAFKVERGDVSEVVLHGEDLGRGDPRQLVPHREDSKLGQHHGMTMEIMSEIYKPNIQENLKKRQADSTSTLTRIQK